MILLLMLYKYVIQILIILSFFIKYIFNIYFQIETLCSTYNPNVFIVMYSVVDERSFDMAEQMLLFLWKGEYIHTRGVILVGNKSDLERTRKIQTNG